MSDEPDSHPTTDPKPPDGSPAAQAGVIEAGSAPEPGDPDYDAFLREVQRLADEREAAGVASGTSTKMRRAVGLFASVLVATIGLALVVAVVLGVFGQSALSLGLAVVGLIGLVTGLISFARIARSGPDGGDSRPGGQ